MLQETFKKITMKKFYSLSLRSLGFVALLMSITFYSCIKGKNNKGSSTNANVSGYWIGGVTGSTDSGNLYLTLTQSGTNLKGSFSYTSSAGSGNGATGSITGTVNGNQVSITATATGSGNSNTVTLAGAVSSTDDSIAGTFTTQGDVNGNHGTWSVTKH
jgi:hypothetical protein